MSSFNDFYKRSSSNNFDNNIGNLRSYELLCVRRNATAEEINENYRKIARVIHPDKNNQCGDKLFTLITSAKNELLGRFSESRNTFKLRSYELLCVRRNATAEEINENYRKIARVIHPDKNNQCGDKLFTLITSAKNELLGRFSESRNTFKDNGQQERRFPKTITEMLSLSGCTVIVGVMNELPKNAAEAVEHGPLRKKDVYLIKCMLSDCENYSLQHVIGAYKNALESKFVCKMCAKPMHLDDICYCFIAMIECHCNSKKCCEYWTRT